MRRRDPFLGADESRRDALRVTEQWVDLGRRGKEPIRRTDDHDEVDVEAARSGEGADVHTVADLSVAGRCHLQFCRRTWRGTRRA